MSERQTRPRRWNGLTRWRLRLLQAGLACGVAAGLAGCGTDGAAMHRLQPYRPDIAAAERTPWRESEAPAEVRPVPAEVPAEVRPVPAEGQFSSLKRGDHVTISIRGVPQPEDIKEVIDHRGHITLPLIGSIRIEGMLSPAAEEAIERAYIDGGFYRRIDVIIVSQEDVFFVRGEVQRPGKYPLVGDVTLLMAISSAGGYTDFANARKIKVIRGDEVKSYNANSIESRKDEDPLIHPNNIIVVDRKFFL